jgi:hypothetical protein
MCELKIIFWSLLLKENSCQHSIFSLINAGFTSDNFSQQEAHETTE